MYFYFIALQTIKQLQQRLAELKRTLQKELVSFSNTAVYMQREGGSVLAVCNVLLLCVFVVQKLKPDPETEGKDKAQEGRGDRLERAERACQEPLSSSIPGLSLGPCLTTSKTTVTNTSDLNDSREINFEYLKHVVLKFMSSREAEVRGDQDRSWTRVSTRNPSKLCHSASLARRFSSSEPCRCC